MASLTTVNVGPNISAIYGSQGSTATPITVLNLDTSNSIWIGNSQTIMAGQPGAIELGPLASMSFDGSISVYGVSSGPTVQVGVIPGGTAYSPGALNISGPVTAEISGSVSIEGTPNVNVANSPAVTVSSGSVNANVSGNVGITGTPSVTVSSGTVNANVSGNVNVANSPAVTVSSGTLNANVTNANIDVIGSGGFILPGQLAFLVKNTATFTANAGLSAQFTSQNVSNYSSILFYSNSPTISSTATGAAVCAHWFLQWTDSSGNIITQDSVSVLLGCEFCVEVPVKGAILNAFLFNTGSVGNISYAANSIFVWGDYRTVPDLTVMSYGISSLPAITGMTLIQMSAPVFSVSKWIANLSAPSIVASTQYLVPLPLWNGQVSGWFQQTTGALTNDATIIDLTYAVQGGIPAGTGYQNGILENLPAAIASSPLEISYNSPPSQLAFIFKPSVSPANTYLQLTGL